MFLANVTPINLTETLLAVEICACTAWWDSFSIYRDGHQKAAPAPRAPGALQPVLTDTGAASSRRRSSEVSSLSVPTAEPCLHRSEKAAPPLWQLPICSLYPWVSFHCVCPFFFPFGFHIEVKPYGMYVSQTVIKKTKFKWKNKIFFLLFWTTQLFKLCIFFIEKSGWYADQEFLTSGQYAYFLVYPLLKFC